MNTLKGKVAIVTGASIGVGRAVAIGLSREGCDVVLAATSKSHLEETARRVAQSGRRGVVCETDIGDPAAVQHLVETAKRELGGVDFCINCAFGHIGEEEGKSLLEVTPNDLQAFAQTSIVGTWLVTREIAPLLRYNNGRFVFIVADWGYPQHNVLLSTRLGAQQQVGSEAFTSAKYAITGLVNSIERRLGVKASGIYPGLIASLKPSSLEGGQPDFFDIDDPVVAIESEEAYKGGWAIPIRDVVDSVLFVMQRHCVVRAVLLKPPTTDYDGLGAGLA